ncbi:MAG: YidC/Oxa1 family membrane protein insertase [Firmicutes bacterium]|nr:YidC/Oxa1 family membrane protein insertase [Bacillota bacterium]
MIQGITDFLHTILREFYHFSGNYGLAIILLTVLIRLVTWPLTSKQLASAKSMQELQPELKKIQEKYKGNKEKLNEETMLLWKKNKVNPVSGCLPLILQFPILIAMFRVLEHPQRLYDTIAGFSPYFLMLDMTQQDPTYILPILSAVTTYWQQKVMMTDKSQQMLLVMMPIMILFFSVSFQAGLVLYWVVNNLLSVGHHLFLNRVSAKGVADKE